MKHRDIALVVAAMLALTGCQKSQQDHHAEITKRQLEIQGQYLIEQQRQAHARDILRQQNQHEMYLRGMQYQHDLEQKEIEERETTVRVKSVSKVIAIVVGIVIGTLAVCFVLYLILRTIVLLFHEWQKSYRTTQMMMIITDGKNGLTDKQREEFTKRLIATSERPALPPPRHGLA